MLAFVFCLLTLSNLSPVEGKYTHVYADTVRAQNGKNGRAKVDTTGGFITINRILIIGNRMTRDHIVLRELSLKSGDVIYNSELPLILEKDEKKIYNTRLFNTVDIRPLELTGDKVDLLIDLNERWYTFPSPIFELSDRNFNEWWQNYNHDFRRINYGMWLYQYNVRGRNETLRLTAQFGFNRKFEVNYRIPYIDQRQKQGLSIHFNYNETKNVAYRTMDHKLIYMPNRSDSLKHRKLKTSYSAGLTYTYRNNFYQTHTLYLDYFNTEILDTVQYASLSDGKVDFFKDGKLRQHFGQVTYQFTSDTRDVMAYPLNGYYFNIALATSALKLTKDLNKSEIRISTGLYKGLNHGLFISNFTYGVLSNTDRIPYNNYSALGYRKMFVRGYEVYVIEGPAFLLNKTTFKKLIFSRVYSWDAFKLEQFRRIPLSIYLKTYADLGYVKNYPAYKTASLNTLFTDKVISGAGMGIDIVGSYDIVIRLEYTFTSGGWNQFFLNVKKEF